MPDIPQRLFYKPAQRTAEPPYHLFFTNIPELAAVHTFFVRTSKKFVQFFSF